MYCAKYHSEVETRPEVSVCGFRKVIASCSNFAAKFELVKAVHEGEASMSKQDIYKCWYMYIDTGIFSRLHTFC